jgi:hypothetical protein
LTGGIALAKFLCAKTGSLRNCVGGDMECRHEAGFPLPSPKNQKNSKKFLKNEKEHQEQKLAYRFLGKTFTKKKILRE